MGHLYFVRHGETVWNVENKICGATDIALTERGHEQAIATGEELVRQGVHIDKILYSPLIRAAETARHISEITGVPRQAEPRLTEQCFGKWDFDAESRVLLVGHLVKIRMHNAGNAVVCDEQIHGVCIRAHIIQQIIDALRQMQFSRPVRAKLDEANKSTGADKVHKGTDLDRAYTGEGVIVSLIDQGIDPNHITFRKKGTTESRVKCLWTALNGKLTAYDTPSKISSFTSDLRTETHGTHVAGIIGGSYTSSSVTFEGVAPGADFAMVGLKSSTDTDILLSIETLIDYAKANGKPLVINISLGSNDGPHDGSSVNDQYYAKLGKEAFICIAAGNEGDLPIAAYHKFSSTNTEMRGFVETSTNENLMAFLEENPAQAKIIMEKCLRAARAREALLHEFCDGCACPV